MAEIAICPFPALVGQGTFERYKDLCRTRLARMDRIEILRYLQAVIITLNGNHEAWLRSSRNDENWETYVRLNDRITRDLPSIRQIAKVIDRNYVDDLKEPKDVVSTWKWEKVKSATLQLIGTLETQINLAEALASRDPQISALDLHPWAWEASARLWQNGHRRDAVRAAAEQINVNLQAKLQRLDTGGTDLVTQAFSLDKPEPGKPRLRFADLEPSTQAFNDAHEGAKNFGRGCFMGIRNPATHAFEDMEEQKGLELLAALSILARWIDEAEVERSNNE